MLMGPILSGAGASRREPPDWKQSYKWLSRVLTVQLCRARQKFGHLAAWPSLRTTTDQDLPMSSSNEAKDERSSQEQSGVPEPGDKGHSGEGAASALAHMISQGQQHRHQTGEADDAAGSRRQ
jgi:hypothetical protein